MTHIASTLAIALADQLERDKRTTDSQIEVIDNNGLVTLSGIALSYEVRSAAAEIALSHPGVLSIINDLDVEDPDATSELGVILPLPIGMSYHIQ